MTGMMREERLNSLCRWSWGGGILLNNRLVMQPDHQFMALISGEKRHLQYNTTKPSLLNPLTPTKNTPKTTPSQYPPLISTSSTPQQSSSSETSDQATITHNKVTVSLESCSKPHCIHWKKGPFRAIPTISISHTTIINDQLRSQGKGYTQLITQFKKIRKAPYSIIHQIGTKVLPPSKCW